MAVCAEAVALGRAFVELGDEGIETIVAVRHPPPDERIKKSCVVSPCGACRSSLIFDYDPKGAGDRAERRGAWCWVAIADSVAEQISAGGRSGERRAPRGTQAPRSPPSAARRMRRKTSLRPRELAESSVRGTGAQEPRDLHRGGAGPARKRSTTSRPRPARVGQDDTGADRGARARSEFPRHTSGPVIAKLAGDLAALLTNLEEL